MPSNLISYSSIGTHCIQRNDEWRIVLIGDVMIKFTPTEYRLLIPLLEGRAVADVELIQTAFNCDTNAQIRKNLEKHIENMRSKLRLHGLCIRRVAKFGYLLLVDTC